MSYSNDLEDICKNIEEYNSNKKQKILIVFDDVITDMLSPIVTELFIRERKLNISLVFIMQSYFSVPKNIILNSTYYFVMKIPNKRELQQIVFNHSSDIDFQDIDFQNYNMIQVLKPEEYKEDRKPVEGLFPKGMRNNEIKIKISEINVWEEKITQKDLPSQHATSRGRPLKDR